MTFGTRGSLGRGQSVPSSAQGGSFSAPEPLSQTRLFDGTGTRNSFLVRRVVVNRKAPRAVITFLKRFSNNCRALKLFHEPSTTHAALAGRTFNKNHWHVTTNLAAHILRHYFNMFVEGLKCNTLRVLEIPRRSQIPSFGWISRDPCTRGLSLS